MVACAAVQTGSEVILIAVAECFTSDIKDEEESSIDGENQDMCLAQQICRFPSDFTSARRAQGYLFNLLVMVTRKPFKLELADNRSANGLIDGLVEIVEGFCNRNLDQGTDEYMWDAEECIPFVPELRETTKQDIAACYCALRILIALSSEANTRPRVLFRNGLLEILTRIVSYSDLHMTFVQAILEVLSLASMVLDSVNDGEISDSVVQALLEVLEGAIGTDEKVMFAYIEGEEIQPTEAVLDIFATLSPEWCVGELHIFRLLEVVANLLNFQSTAQVSSSVVEVARRLASSYPRLAGEDEAFVSGVIKLFKNQKCVNVATSILKLIHEAHPLHQYAEDIQKYCPWDILSPTELDSKNAATSDTDESKNKMARREEAEVEEKGNNEENIVTVPDGTDDLTDESFKDHAAVKSEEVHIDSVLATVFGDHS